MTEANTPAKKYREVLVVPLAARREAMILALVIGLIVLLMAYRFSMFSSEGTTDSMRPYQLIDLKLKNQAPALYRSLLGSVQDILDLREEEGQWPDIALLQSEALPPFANNYLPVGLRGYVWQQFTGEGWVDYFGVNADAAQEEQQGKDPLENSFILRIIDLQSTKHPHPHFGQHDGQTKRFSAQIWLNPKTTDYPGEKLVEKGWKWVVSQGASPEGQVKKVISEEPGQ